MRNLQGSYKMKFSIITPTYERNKQLQAAYTLIKGQRYGNWEWLIYDTSLRQARFNDPRVIYLHDTACLSVGEKRNRLAERASGSWIVHFDDDDYYAPSYLEGLVPYLEQAALFKRHGWFSFHRASRQFFYWDAEELSRVRYTVSPLFGRRIKEIEFDEEKVEPLCLAAHKGFGFSLAYRKELWQNVAFKDVDFGEDSLFVESAEKKGWSSLTAPDQKGEFLHIIHDTNLSSEYPQYRIPPFLAHGLFPHLPAYLELAYEN